MKRVAGVAQGVQTIRQVVAVPLARNEDYRLRHSGWRGQLLRGVNVLLWKENKRRVDVKARRGEEEQVRERVEGDGRE